MKYQEARAKAQKQADETGEDVGVEKDMFGYHTLGLPRRENRYGNETRCEVVHPSDLKKCKPGHGPIYKRPGEAS
jgi:hypothetical protein